MYMCTTVRPVMPLQLINVISSKLFDCAILHRRFGVIPFLATNFKAYLPQ